MQTLASENVPPRTIQSMVALLILVLTSALFASGTAHAQSRTPPYLSMPPIADYRTASREDEAAMARSAAPPSISDQAKVLVLGDHGYEIAAEGSNGFVCIVQRGWANEFGNAEFWNPNTRSPVCFNPVSARSVLPTFLMRTEWVLAGKTVPQMQAMTADAMADGRIVPPETGAMCYMMSKLGFLSDEDSGPWHPHLMFFVPEGESAEWGANLAGVPIIGGPTNAEPFSIFLLTVERWSDGSPERGPQQPDHEHGG